MRRSDIDLAHWGYENAAKRLCAVTARAFPVGTEVLVTLGRARVHGRVTSVSDYYWCDAGVVFIENVATGKARKFWSFDKSLDVVIIKFAGRTDETTSGAPPTAIGASAELPAASGNLATDRAEDVARQLWPEISGHGPRGRDEEAIQAIASVIRTAFR